MTRPNRRSMNADWQTLVQIPETPIIYSPLEWAGKQARAHLKMRWNAPLERAGRLLAGLAQSPLGLRLRDQIRV
jgi:hypothetical protein